MDKRFNEAGRSNASIANEENGDALRADQFAKVGRRCYEQLTHN